MAIRSGTISVGDKVVLVTGVNGQRYAVKPASPQVGDKVILYPLRNGGYACLFPAGAEGEEGEPSHPVMPPANFHAFRTGPSTADLDWFPGEGNTAVRIMRRSDRYPTHIRDGTVAYEGGGDEVEDTGLDYRLPYYYCAWGKEGSKYSNGYLMDEIPNWLGPPSNPVHVCDVWARPVVRTGEIVSFGPFSYLWYGQGKVYISSSPAGLVNMWADDQIRVYTPVGSITKGYWSQDRYVCEITSILNTGLNEITIKIVDIYGYSIGSSALYIMRML